MIDRRSARRRLPDCPAAHLAAEAALDLDGHPARLPVTQEGQPTSATLAGERASAPWSRFAALLAGYDRGDSLGVGGRRSRRKTTACTRTWSRSQATTRRMVPSSS